MKRLLIALSLALAACQENPPQPREVCAERGAVYSCGRGGECVRCNRHKIGCPEPLELQSKPDGTLICRLKGSSS